MAFITIRHPDDRIENIALSQEKELTIGRASTNDLCFPKDPKISSRHCRIYYSPESGNFVLSDLRSTNGTVLNLNRISVDVALSDNDKIRIGDIRALFRNGELNLETTTTTKKVLKLASTRDIAPGLRTDTCVIPNFANIRRKPKLTLVNDYKLTTGETIGSYQILRKIADFQYGCIYSALGKDMNAGSVALKIFNAAFDIHHPAIDEFTNEVMTMRKIENPYFVRTLDGGAHFGHCFIVMDFISVDDLNMKIARHAPFPEFEALSIAYTVASALEIAHSSVGCIHGMLSPASVLIDSDDNLMIKGHGLANWMTKYIAGGKPITLPWYTSPEQAMCAPFDWQSDVYSLGIILFQLLTGSVPFHSTSDREILDMQLRTPLPDTKAINPNTNVSAPTHEMLAKMTSKSPKGRYASWQEILTRMEEISATLN